MMIRSSLYCLLTALCIVFACNSPTIHDQEFVTQNVFFVGDKLALKQDAGNADRKNSVQEYKEVVIQGKVLNAKDGLELFLFVSKGNVKVREAQIRVVNGDFTHRLQLEESPVKLRISNSHNRMRKDFWVEKGTVNLMLDIDNVNDAEVSGMSFYGMETNFLKKYNRDETLTEQVKLIKEHIEAPSAIYNLYRIYNQLPLEVLRSTLHLIDKKWNSNDYMATMMNYVELGGVEIPKEGASYVDFIAEDQNGHRFQFAEFLKNTNKELVLLEFKNLYCRYSEKAIKELSQVSADFEDSLELVTFITDTRSFLWERYLESDSTKWTKVWDGHGEVGKTCLSYGAKGSPYYFLMNPQGVILNYWSGYEQDVMKVRIAELLNNDD